jgi:hypothetical protein
MVRTNIKSFQDIPNVGAATEQDFLLLGLKSPIDLINKDPYKLYEELCHITQQKHDPCVIDVFIASVKYMQGEPAKKWWEYTSERKATLAAQG